MNFLRDLVLCAALFASTGKAQVEFSYEGEDGPDRWPQLFAKCGGQRQSPIDIRLNQTQNAASPPLWLNYAGYIPWEANLTNDGHTALMRLNAGIPILLYGAVLRGPYVFQQMHFHWGANDSVGSEHAINSKFSALEMHMVFYKQEYGSPGSAANHSDGFAVLSVLYDLRLFGSVMLATFVRALPSIPEDGDSTTLSTRVALDWLLPFDRTAYTYPGSLTTPPCDEVVTWLVFNQHAAVTSSQVAAFRTLKTEDGSQLESNRRPLQPLGDRNVTRLNSGYGFFFGKSGAPHGKSGAPHGKSGAPHGKSGGRHGSARGRH